MKIVIATAVYYPMINGVAVFSHNLAVGLAERGNEVMVICPSQTGRAHTEKADGVTVKYLRSTEAKVYPDQIHDVPKKKKLFYEYGFRVSLLPGRAIKRILDKFSPDVIHVQVSDPIGLAAVRYARQHNVPVVTTEHNQPEVITEPLNLPKVIERPVNALLSAYFANRQSKSDFVTMPTEQAIDNLLWSKGRELKVPVAAVSNGVDLRHFKPGRASDGMYKKYGVDKNKKTVLYLGRIDPEKNVQAVIDAYIKAKNNVNDIQLVIVGDGVDKARLEKYIGDTKDVHFLGRVTPPELYEVYKFGDVFVTASEIETQGIVLIEAAACGMPLVAVNAGAVREVCRDGENGVLCEPGNVTQMAEATVKILTDDKLRKSYSKKSLEIAKEHDFERTLDRFENIYRKVMGGKTPR